MRRFRCYFSRPFRHRWKVVNDSGRRLLRCARCGRETRLGSFSGNPSSGTFGGPDW